MKKFSIALMALGFLSITIQSCTSDPCKDKSATTLCSGKGTLVSNTNSCDCSCEAGYTGTSCSTTVITTLIKTWSNSTSSTYNGVTTPFSASSSISTVASGNIVDIVIMDLGAGYKSSGSLVQTKAKITNSTTITLDETPQGGYVFKGTGVLQSDNSWKFTYTVTYILSGGTTRVDNNVTILR
jgi:hypothetical protein